MCKGWDARSNMEFRYCSGYQTQELWNSAGIITKSIGQLGVLVWVNTHGGQFTTISAVC